jgi:outer membrane protein assembly factor BamB
MRRTLILVAVLLAGCAGLLVALLQSHAAHDVRGSSTVDFGPTLRAPVIRPKATLAWPMFGRGPERQAAAGGTRVRPPFRRAWVAGGRSLIEFPPAVGYGRIFFGDGAGRVIALAAASGERAWTFESHRGVAAGAALGAFAHGTVYEAFLNRLPSHAKDPHDGAVIALAAGTGHVRWRAHVGASETSPLLVGRRLFVGGWDGRVYAVDAFSGRKLWAFATGGAIKGGLAASDGTVFAGSYDGHVYALDAATGRLLWRASAQPRLFGHGRFYSTPAVAYGRVYIGSTDGAVYSFDARTGATRWVHHSGSYVYGSAAVSHGLVFAGSYDHDFYAFDAATGDVVWRFTANGPISGSAAVIDGVVYFATLRGRSYGLDARSGRLLWSFGDGKYAPAVSDGSLLVVTGYGILYGLTPTS